MTKFDNAGKLLLQNAREWVQKKEDNIWTLTILPFQWSFQTKKIAHVRMTPSTFYKLRKYENTVY